MNRAGGDPDCLDFPLDRLTALTSPLDRLTAFDGLVD